MLIIFLFFLLVMSFIATIIYPAFCQQSENQKSELSITSITAGAQQAPIYIAKFSEPGCHDCERVDKLLEQIVFEYPQVEIKNFDICLPEGVELAEQLGEFYNVPENERLLVPIVFLGDDYFLRDSISYDKIIKKIKELETKEKSEIVPPWEKVENSGQSAKNRLIERFQSFGWGAVAISGLLDGINPCAFATIIFFISYLTLVNRKGRELLWVGGMFTLAVFITYFLIGTGALKVVTSLSFLPLARKIFCFVTATVGFILGWLSLRDYLKFRRTGETSDATLQLPPRIKKMIHSTIRQNVKTHHFVLMAAATGFLVSVLELACTGQIYLPTLIFISHVPELRANALVYCLFMYLLGYRFPAVGRIIQKEFWQDKAGHDFFVLWFSYIIIYNRSDILDNIIIEINEGKWFIVFR